MTDLIILTTLLGVPKHGYQLKHEAGVILGQGTLHNNLVYPLLRRFMNKKWVRQKMVPGERGQTRNQYSLTAVGRKELRVRLSSFNDQDARSADSFHMRVSLFWFLAPEVRLQILEDGRKYLEGRLATLTNVQNNFSLGRYAAEVMTHMETAAKSEIDWIERLRRFEKSRKDDSRE
jgi:DNA-binding PadR family transcriptional regulator